MKIKNHDGEIIGEIVTNHSLVLDDAMELIGYPWVVDDNDAGYLVNGIYYSPDDLIMVND